MDDQTMTMDRIADFTAAGPKGAQLPLAQITNFDWDLVYDFSASMPPDQIAKALGDAYTPWDRPSVMDNEDAAELVFVKNGEIVQRLEFPGPIHLVGSDAKPHGRDAVLEVRTRDPGPYNLIRLSDQMR